MRRPRLATLGVGMRVIDTRAARPAAKTDPYYLSAGHRAWRELVIRRAGGRCEAIENGRRCERAEPEDTMFADHVIERADGGAALDPANGQCLCGRHHTLKTLAARARRHVQG